MTTKHLSLAILQVSIKWICLMPLINSGAMMKHIISLGAGVQSSTMALMAKHGEITPMPECAIFADTQAEPATVYKQIEWLKAKLPFPIITGTYKSLEKDALQQRVSKKTGKNYIKQDIPAFIDKGDSVGLLGRQCTADYKVAVLRREVKKFLGLAPRARWPKELAVSQWLGISYDEIQRMKVSTEAWMEFRHPLIDMKMTRSDCLQWMSNNGYPEPPRSACVFCPFHSDAEWRNLKDNYPHEFERAVTFEKNLQKIAPPAIKDRNLQGLPYLHRSCKPIDEIDFKDYNDQMEFSFLDECAGMCGV